MMNSEDATHVTPTCVVSTSHQIKEENKTRGEKIKLNALSIIIIIILGGGGLIFNFCFQLYICLSVSGSSY